MSNACTIALAAALACGGVARPTLEFTAETPLRTRIVTEPLDEACAVEYLRVPLAQRMRYGEVRDEVLVTAARRFYENFVADHAGWPAMNEFTKTARERGRPADAGTYAAEVTRRRRADEAALREWLLGSNAVETPGRPEFRAYGTCLRRAVIERLRQLPPESYFPLKPERVIREIEPDPVPTPRR